MSTAVAAWSSTLDRLEADLAAAQAAIDANGDVPIVTLRPRSDLGPMPPEVADRARALARRHDTLRAAVVARLDTIGAAMTAATRRGATNTARSSANFEMRA